MKRLLPIFVLVATGCGSTGTEAGGDDDDGTGTPFTCTSFQQGAGIICDSTTNPPTIRVDFGPNAGQAVEGPTVAAIDPNRGRYISSFVPSATEAPAGTANGPGPTGAFLIQNPATGRIGIRGADELCKVKNPTFANAHVCTNEEIIWNVRNGLITNGMSGIAIGAHQDPGGGGVRSSFRGTCGMLTYNTGDLQYTGTRWEAVQSDPKNAAPDDANALVVNFVGGIPCNTTGTAIACCQ